MRLELCDTAVWLESDGQRSKVPGQRGLLLRLLTLWPAQKVPQDLACAVLGIKRNGLGTYLKALRSDLGGKSFVVSEDGLIYLDIPGLTTDFAAFESTLESALEIANGADFETLPKELALRLRPSLDAAERIWKGSPATGLDRAVSDPDISDDLIGSRIQLESLCDEWLDKWTDCRILRADCLIAEGSEREVRSAISELMSLARTPAPTERVWKRLLTACNMLSDRQRGQTAWDLCRNYYTNQYGSPPPESLTELSPPQLQTLPFRRDSKPAIEGIVAENASILAGIATSESGDPRLPLIELLGITTASALHLRGSRLEPEDCIERTQNRLYFSGVLASKWVTEAAVRVEFEKLLYRLDTQDEPGDVRFLIIDPNSDAYERLGQLRGGKISDESVPHLLRLAKQYQSFEVRGINRLPAFRIIAIDDDVVSFSPYALAGEAYATSRRGWDAPHVMLDPQAPWPLASAFRLYFEEAWDAASPIKESNLDH